MIHTVEIVIHFSCRMDFMIKGYQQKSLEYNPEDGQ